MDSLVPSLACTNESLVLVGLAGKAGSEKGPEEPHGCV